MKLPPGEPELEPEPEPELLPFDLDLLSMPVLQPLLSYSPRMESRSCCASRSSFPRSSSPSSSSSPSLSDFFSSSSSSSELLLGNGAKTVLVVSVVSSVGILPISSSSRALPPCAFVPTPCGVRVATAAVPPPPPTSSMLRPDRASLSLCESPFPSLPGSPLGSTRPRDVLASLTNGKQTPTGSSEGGSSAVPLPPPSSSFSRHVSAIVTSSATSSYLMRSPSSLAFRGSPLVLSRSNSSGGSSPAPKRRRSAPPAPAPAPAPSLR
mmetsp:Transcript_49408/g.148876  ORF Transcript_49408/g.148876 Transcript_49408/m.148876 type:complete len:266 (+) Transcript_49408:2334-3131(+)